MLFECGRKSILDIFKVVGSLRDDTELSFSENGCSLTVIDPSNAALVKVDLPKQYFKQLCVKEEIKAHVDLTDKRSGLIKILSSLKYDIISLKKVENGILYFNCGYTDFTIKCYSDEFKLPKAPKMEFKYTYKVNTAEFIDIISFMGVFSDQVTFESNLISAEGDMCTSVVPLENVVEYLVEPKGQYKTVIAVNKLLPTLKLMKNVCKTVLVCSATDYPISICGIGEREETVELLVAPRLEE